MLLINDITIVTYGFSDVIVACGWLNASKAHSILCVFGGGGGSGVV